MDKQIRPENTTPPPPLLRRQTVSCPSIPFNNRGLPHQPHDTDLICLYLKKGGNFFHNFCSDDALRKIFFRESGESNVLCPVPSKQRQRVYCTHRRDTSPSSPLHQNRTETKHGQHREPKHSTPPCGRVGSERGDHGNTKKE